jgi:hypothetical protein
MAQQIRTEPVRDRLLDTNRANGAFVSQRADGFRKGLDHDLPVNASIEA